ncbi:phage capsid protein [Ferrovibrio sp.]|uniref:major capsid protein n=1 Tax=Ferrovibrio sp. TaxID=1917215 RepID=UPI0035B449F2
MSNTTTVPFPVDPKLIAIAAAHTNPDVTLIADEVLPRISEIGVENFSYFEYDLAQGFTIPDMQVGRTGQPNQLEFTGSEKTSRTRDYGLESPIPNKDIAEAANKGIRNPVELATFYLTGLVKLGREVRVANKVFTGSLYAASNKVALAGTDQLSDYTNSDPITVLETAINTPVIKPNYLVMGEAVWRKLRRHPKLAKAIYGNQHDGKAVRREDLATELEIKGIFVGESRLNTAKPGLTPTYAGAWGKHICAFFRDQSAGIQGGVTFGYQVPRKGFQAGALPDAKIGVEGGQLVRVWESQDEVISAPHLGYLIQNAVA